MVVPQTRGRSPLYERWLLAIFVDAGMADHVMENSKWRCPLEWADR